ncbi:MAG: hypothetical protein FT671_02440 [Pantoea sp. Brub]|nr:hypothetical protein [Pantoea sp. Brub]
MVKKKIINDEQCLLSALRLSSGIPPVALDLLNNKNWEIRNKLCEIFPIAIQSNILEILPIFVENDTVMCINWLIYFLIDAMKWQQNIKTNLINIDQTKLIQLISEHFNFNKLNNSIYEWTFYRNAFLNNTLINKELLITYLLLNLINKTKMNFIQY